VDRNDRPSGVSTSSSMSSCGWSLTVSPVRETATTVPMPIGARSS
jgi:hypothetical protein